MPQRAGVSKAPSIWRDFIRSRPAFNEDFHLPNANKPWLISGGAVVGLHLVFLLMLSSNVGSMVDPAQRELSVSIIDVSTERRPVPPPVFQKPTADTVPAPEIEIEEPTVNSLSQIAIADAGRVQPPRPNPAYVNPFPELPAGFRQLGPSASVLIKILVLSDGTVSDARIAQSTGDTKLDEIALQYVRQHWRFLPALYSGVAVQYWTTTLVMFRSA